MAPKMEVDKIFEVPDDFLAELLIFAKPIAKAIEQSFPCNRVGMVTIGLEVPHAHLHLIPINEAKDMEFSQPKLKLSKEEFEAIQKSIQSHLPA